MNNTVLEWLHDPVRAYVAGVGSLIAVGYVVEGVRFLHRRFRPAAAGCAGCGCHERIDAAVHVVTEGYVDPWHRACLAAATTHLPVPVTGSTRDIERLIPDAPELPPAEAAIAGGAV